MEANFTPLSDQQRLDVLNMMYQKGLNTPQEELAFSADKLVYLKPFLTKLQNEDDQAVKSVTNLALVRQVVDELLIDIKEEVDAACARVGRKAAQKMAVEYGVNILTEQYKEDFYFVNKVA